MARGASLLELTGELRVELGRAANLAVGPGDIPMLQRTLRRVQKTLWLQYDWPFMRKVFDIIPLVAGQRYYDPPTNLDLERIESVAIWQNDQPVPIRRGISWGEYASYKPGDRADPTMAWDMRTFDDYSCQIEVWPTPASGSYGLQIIGVRNLRPFVADADLCDLDDELILLYSTAQILSRQKADDASLVGQMASEHLARMRARASSGDSRRIRMGMGPDQSRLDQRSRITVAGYPVKTP